MATGYILQMYKMRHLAEITYMDHTILVSTVAQVVISTAITFPIHILY